MNQLDKGSIELYQDIAEFMKKNHIIRLKVEGLELEMYPTGFASGKIPELLKNEDMCKCGHSLHHHGDEGHCIEGCSPEQCASKG